MGVGKMAVGAAVPRSGTGVAGADCTVGVASTVDVAGSVVVPESVAVLVGTSVAVGVDSSCTVGRAAGVPVGAVVGDGVCAGKCSISNAARFCASHSSNFLERAA